MSTMSYQDKVEYCYDIIDQCVSRGQVDENDIIDEIICELIEFVDEDLMPNEEEQNEFETAMCEAWRMYNDF